MVDCTPQGHNPIRDTPSSQGPTQSVSANSSPQSVGMATVSTIAARSDTDPVALDSRHPSVNPDALDTIFRPGTDGQVAFTYNRYEAVVRTDGDAGGIVADE